LELHAIRFTGIYIFVYYESQQQHIPVAKASKQQLMKVKVKEPKEQP